MATIVGTLSRTGIQTVLKKIFCKRTIYFKVCGDGVLIQLLCFGHYSS
jgi:hypothetical protein